MSQLSILNTDDLISLSLHKFSYATTVHERANPRWTHCTGRDKFAVFDSVTAEGVGGILTKDRLLKVIIGGETLEQISFADLVRQAHFDEQRARSTPLSDSNRTVIVITKKPLVAIRYHLSNGQIRRIQMNFAPESGYDTALRILTRFGLPIRKKNSQGEPSSTLLARNFASIPSQGVQDFSRHTTPGGASVIPYPPQHSNDQFEQRSANSVFSRNHSFAQTHLTSDPSSVSADSRSQIHTADGRLQNHTISASGYGPYEARVEPTRHPQYAPINLADPEMLDEMNSGSGRPLTAPVIRESLWTETLSQLLPPKRELPFGKLGPKEVREDFSAAQISPNVPEPSQANGKENETRLDNTPPKSKATEKNEITMRMKATLNTATPTQKAVSKKKATPRKTMTPKKKAAPRKKATPKAKAPAKSKKDLNNRNKMALELREPTPSNKPLDLPGTHRTESAIEPNLLLAEAPPVILQNVALATQNHAITSDLEEIHRPDSGNMQSSATPPISIMKLHPAGRMSSESPVATAEWIKEVNKFMDESKEYLEQTSVPCEPQLITPEWINKVDEFIRESKSYFQHAKTASEYPVITAEWMDQVNSFMKKGRRHFLVVEMLSAAPLVTKEWIHRVDDARTRQNEHSDLVDRFMSKTQSLLEQHSQILKRHQNCTSNVLSPASGKYFASQTTGLRAPNAQETSPLKDTGKRRLGSDYGLTPAARNSKRPRTNTVQPLHSVLRCKDPNVVPNRLPRLGPEFEW